MDEQTPPNYLVIHQTNIFQPHKLGVSCIASSPDKLHLASRRGYLNPKDINGPFTQIDFYDIGSKIQPRHLHTIIEHEDITGISWLDEKHLVSVSTKSTINIYSIRTGTKVKTLTTDYGPINCMRHSFKDNLLVTGTEYGYAVVYKISVQGLVIECVEKMVKLTDPIVSIDFYMKPRKAPLKKKNSLQPPSLLLGHLKRKRSDSSDESEDEVENPESGQQPEGEFLEMNDLTIYGGYLDKVVAWDYHRTTIIDTLIVGNQVTSVMVLKSGNVAVADAAGYLGIIDPNTFTCRQSDRLLGGAILTLSSNTKNSRIIAAGKDPMIAVLEIDKSSETEDVYILREKIKDHSGSITCSLFTTKKEFFTGSDDNQIIKFRLSRSSEGHQKMKRFYIMPLYKNKLHFSNHEAMAIFGKSIQIFKFKPCNKINSDLPTRESLPEPQRICTIRAGAYIHSATLDDKWICYSTAAGLKILDRPNLSRVDTTKSKLHAAHIMRIFDSGRFLVVGQQRRLAVIELKSLPELGASRDQRDDHENGIDEGVDVSAKCQAREHKSIFEMRLKGVIREMLYYKSSNQLVVSCGTTGHFIYIFKLPSSGEADGEKGDVKILLKTGVKTKISHIAQDSYNQINESNLYIYTSRDQLIECNVTSETLKKDLIEMESQRERIKGLPKNVGIQGLVVLSPNQFLINDNIYIFKVSLETNEVVNSTADYAKIIAFDNSVFKHEREVLVVSMT